MFRFKLLPYVISALLCAPAGIALAAKPAPKAKINPAPAVELFYSVKARQSGLTLNGDTVTRWNSDGKSYSVSNEIRAALVGKILDEKSEGALDDFGLAPASYTEKRFRKDAATASFNRDSKTISFSASPKTYPLSGGEQDRASAMWQLISIARATPAKFKPGASWSFLVAGQHDADPWTFKVTRQEKLRTPLGEVSALHVVRSTPGASGQQLDIWLSPAHEWYPVRLRLAEADGEYVEQTLERIARK